MLSYILRRIVATLPVMASVALFGGFRAGAMARTTAAVRGLTGRPPRTVGQFARDHADLFGAGAVAPEPLAARSPA